MQQVVIVKNTFASSDDAIRKENFNEKIKDIIKKSEQKKKSLKTGS